MHFEGIETFARFVTDLAVENPASVLMNVADMGLQYVRSGKLFSTHVAA